MHKVSKHQSVWFCGEFDGLGKNKGSRTLQFHTSTTVNQKINVYSKLGTHHENLS